jgi:DNA-binding LacI/PurR family transcriptional regulator
MDSTSKYRPRLIPVPDAASARDRAGLPVRIADVAARAGVAVSTASRVLNGLPAGRDTAAAVREAAAELGYDPRQHRGGGSGDGPRRPRPGNVDIRDVAQRAGVSIASVSRALRGLPGVSEATRQAVQEASDELGYVVSPAASALAGGQTRVVAIVSPFVSGWYFTSIIEAVQDLLALRGYDLMLYPVGEERDHIKSVIRNLHRKVDGIITLSLTPLTQIGDPGYLQVPVVTVGSEVPGVSAVTINDVEVGRLAAQHLLDLGHRDIVYLGQDPAADLGSAVASDRGRGVDMALRDAGIELPAATSRVTGFTVADGMASMEAEIARVAGDLSRLPTAIVAVSDEAAMGIMHAARGHGLAVPDDLSVIGIDNHSFAFLFDLTTMGQPIRDIGQAAAELMLAQIGGDTCNVRHFDVALVTRNSTGPPRQW